MNRIKETSAVFVISLFLAGLVMTYATPARTKSDVLNSIQPLEKWATDVDTGEEYLDIFCTAWAAMYEDKHVWLTAAHCLDWDDEGKNATAKDFLVDKKPVTLLAFEMSKTADVAIFGGGPKADPLRIAFSSPSPLQPIWGAGFPMGGAARHVVAGVWSVERDDDGFSAYSLAVAPGMSGGPVLDKDSFVVGLLRRSECPRLVQWCAVSGGTPVSELRRVLHLN